MECVMVIATAITAIATVVIGWATWVSSRLFSLQRKIERANRMPILFFSEERTGNAADERTRDERSLFVKNVGYGPALNIVRELIHTGEVRATGTQGPLPLGSLAPGERVYAFLLSRDVSVILDAPEFHAVIEYDDILGQSYEVIYRNRTHSTPVPIAKRKMPPSQAQRI
jgi:hypothetical protein